MRFKAISAIIVTLALIGASAGAALAMGNSPAGSTGAKAGVERFWVGNWFLRLAYDVHRHRPFHCRWENCWA